MVFTGSVPKICFIFSEKEGLKKVLSSRVGAVV